MTNEVKKQLGEFRVAEGIAEDSGYYDVFYSNENGFYIWHSSNGKDMRHLPTLSLSLEDILTFIGLHKQDFFDFIVESKRNAILGHIVAYKKEIQEIEDEYYK